MQVEFKGKMFNLVGNQVKVGDSAPDFKACTSGLELIGIGQTPAKTRMFSVVPSLDTPVCSEQTKKFDAALASLKDKVVCYTVSLDMPFAQKRFCTAENLTNVQTLSDLHNMSFGKAYGVLIEGLPVPLLSRAIIVVNKEGKVTYTEYVPSVPQHPNYDKAIEAMKAAG